MRAGSIRACLAGLGLNSCSSLTVTPVFELRRVAVRMHRSTIINQLKSCEARLNAVIFIGGRLRKRNSAKQALRGAKSRAACRSGRLVAAADQAWQTGNERLLYHINLVKIL